MSLPQPPRGTGRAGGRGGGARASRMPTYVGSPSSPADEGKASAAAVSSENHSPDRTSVKACRTCQRTCFAWPPPCDAQSRCTPPRRQASAHTCSSLPRFAYPCRWLNGSRASAGLLPVVRFANGQVRAAFSKQDTHLYMGRVLVPQPRLLAIGSLRAAEARGQVGGLAP